MIIGEQLSSSLVVFMVKLLSEKAVPLRFELAARLEDQKGRFVSLGQGTFNK